MSRSHPPGMALPESRARTSPGKCHPGEVRNLISPRCVCTASALSDAPPPRTTISQRDTRDIVWCNAPKHEGRITPTCRFLTKRKKAEVVHRVFLGDYVKIYDASDPNLYMVTGVTWFPLTAKKRRAEPPTPVLFSPSRPLLRTQCKLSFAGARGGPRRSLTKAFNKAECMPVAGCALQADLYPLSHPHLSGVRIKNNKSLPLVPKLWLEGAH